MREPVAARNGWLMGSVAKKKKETLVIPTHGGGGRNLLEGSKQ